MGGSTVCLHLAPCLEATTSETAMPSSITTQKRIAGRSTAATGALVKEGQKGIIKDSDTKNAQKKIRDSTQRALVLREAIMGKGEVVGRMSGREKLELLAGASTPPFVTFTRV